MNDFIEQASNFKIPPIVNERDNGLTYLEALCNLFNISLDSIPVGKRTQALQLFGGLYVFPAIESGKSRVQTLNELDALCEEYFPMPEFESGWEAVRYGAKAGMANAGWGTNNPDVRTCYYNTKGEMIVYNNRWRHLTMGDAEDLLLGYRWRRIVTGFMEVALITAGGAAVTTGPEAVAGAASARAVEGYIKGGAQEAIRQGTARLTSGGSGVAQAVSKGKGVKALASRGGAVGLFAVYNLGYLYAHLKDEEDDIRDAIALRVLNDEIDEFYLDELNGPIDAGYDLVVDIWYE